MTSRADLDAMLDRFQHLPPKIQDFLSSLDFVNFIERLTQEYALNEQQKQQLTETIQKIFFKELPVRQSFDVFKTKVLPASADANAFFDELVNAGMFDFPDYFGDASISSLSQRRESTVQPKTSQEDVEWKPSAEDVRLRTGIDFGSKQQISTPQLFPVQPLALSVADAKLAVAPQPVSAPRPKAPTTHAPTTKSEPSKEPERSDRVATMIDQFKLSWADERLKQRLQRIVQAFLKDVRDAKETQAYLERHPKIGGLGLKLPVIENIMAALKKEKQVLMDHAKASLNTKKMEEQAPSFFPDEQEAWPMNSEIPEEFIQPKLKPVAAETKPQPQTSVSKTEPVAAASVRPPAPPISDPAKVQQKKVVVQATAGPLPQAKPATKPSVSPSGPKPIPRVRRTPLQSDRPVLMDIRHPKEVMGPVDELRLMTLRDFRELASNATGSAQKVLEKLLILEQESVAKKVEGIRAWKSSEVNQTYVEIGKASLLSNRSVADVIQERSAQRVPSLTEEEFTAIADLNHQLRF